MYDLVTFGEAMIRLSPPNFQRLEQTSSLDIQIGGAEYNVACAGARLGLKTAWVSRLPENGLARRIVNKAREHGVDTSHVVWTKEGRVGLYFLEQGSSPRASSVLYDRAPSAIAEIKPGEVDWKKVLAGTKLFHTTGITPALSASAAQVTKESLEGAKAAGCRVSYDLNFRKKLWSAEQARKVQEPFMALVDLLITNEEDPKAIFGISPAGHDDAYKALSAEAYREIAKKLQERFALKGVAITMRESPSVLKNVWTAMAYEGGKFYEERKYELEVVDRLGGGDSFSAGLLYGIATKNSIEYGLKFGLAFSALKHTTPGDLNWATREEVEELIKSGGGARVQR
jgi:2-dehydro-3-deoxygluconokinase